MKYPNLFKPITLGNVRIKNRIYMGPMHTNLTETLYQGYNPRFSAFMVERAKGGAGLIVTGHVKAEKTIDAYPATYGICIDDPHAVKVFADMVEGCHNYGAKVAIQLSAGGGRLVDSPLDGHEPVAPSAVPTLYFPDIMTRELTKEEIQGLVKAYGAAAANAKAAGFDIIMLHALAYLFDQFLTSAWNHRTDEYGGSLENRMRFMMECYDAARAAVGDDFPIMLTIAMDQGIPNGRPLEETIEIIKAFEKKGICAVQVRNGSYDNQFELVKNNLQETMHAVPGAEVIKKAVNIPVLVDGSLLMPENCEQVLVDGIADMTGVCRPLLADPEWPNKARRGADEDIRPCLRCMECMGRLGPRYIGCSVNPVLGREIYTVKGKADESKKVLVVGGGVAGITASVYAAKRGHEVILAEATDALGGHMIEGSTPEFKFETRNYLEWMKRDLAKSTVDVRMNTKVDVEFVKECNPDAVIVATGSVPTLPPVPGIDKDSVHTAAEVLIDNSLAGENVVVIGAGLVGCETALDLARKGRKVTLVEMLPEIGMEIGFLLKFQMLGGLAAANVNCKPSTIVKEIKDGNVVVSTGDLTEEIVADTVVVATGMKSVYNLYEEIQEVCPDVYMVGDANNPRKFFYANREAYEIAMAL